MGSLLHLCVSCETRTGIQMAGLYLPMLATVQPSYYLTDRDYSRLSATSQAGPW